MNDLLMQGLQLMGVGMGVVFLFLGLLIGIVAGVSALIQKGEVANSAPGNQPMNDNDLLVILTEAVGRYRADHPRS
jgi:oxaloacetate decarboxylase gamma subunit